jgi:hypothetical protein
MKRFGFIITTAVLLCFVGTIVIWAPPAGVAVEANRVRQCLYKMFCSLCGKEKREETVLVHAAAIEVRRCWLLLHPARTEALA